MYLDDLLFFGRRVIFLLTSLPRHFFWSVVMKSIFFLNRMISAGFLIRLRWLLEKSFWIARSLITGWRILRKFLHKSFQGWSFVRKILNSSPAMILTWPILISSRE